MKSVSIENVFQWAQHFVTREWRLLLPVAFAFLALPGLILALPSLQASLASLPSSPRGVDPVALGGMLRWVFPLMLVILLFGAFGGLAITALALVPAISVREALILAAQRIGILVGSVVLVILGEMAIVLGLTFILGLARLGGPALQSLLMLLLVGLGIFVGVRLFPLVPMIVRRRIGPVSALRETWLLTHGVFWPIFGAAAVYLIGALVVMLASATAVGALLMLLGRAVGAPELANVLNMIFGQAVAALVALGLHVVAVAVFRQLDGSSRGM